MLPRVEHTSWHRDVAGGASSRWPTMTGVAALVTRTTAAFAE
jgi:hypothetical protein